MVVKRSVQCKECGKWIDVYLSDNIRKFTAKCKCGNIEKAERSGKW